jgi:broad specificity phosphatase PhoE
MKITYIRHLEVDFKWSRMCSSEEFDAACQTYDTSKTMGSVRSEPYSGTVYTSTLCRTEETAKALFGNDTGIIKTDLLNEVPLQSFMTTPARFPTWVWMIIGRAQWYINNTSQTETKRQSKQRIIAFLDLIQVENQDCVIVGHGFYFTEFVKELKTRGARGNMNRRIKTGEKREFILPLSRNN